MLQQALNPIVRRSVIKSLSSYRAISSTAIRMAEGDTGGLKSGGAASSDAFSKRETASEAKYVKEKELEKLKALRAKIKEQQKHLEELDTLVDGQMASQGKE